MCQVIEHITIKATGHRQTRQETTPCSKGQRGNLCSNVVRRSTEYYPDASSTSSRESNGPFTPPTVDGPGYKTEIHRPSSSTSSGTRRPSVVTPGVVIEIGGRSGTRIYPKAPKSYNKRSSFGGASTHSNEAVLDSPNSDKFRTGFPEAPFAPSAYPGHSDSYSYGHASHRHTPSISSQTTPSLVHSLPPEPDSPSGRRPSRYSTPMIHNGPPAAPSTTASRAAQPSSSATSSRANYRTETITPRFATNNYDDFVSRPSASTHSSSGRDEAPEITMRGAYREEQRAERKRRDEADRRNEERMEKEEKQVRFVDDRDKYRNDQRAEKAYAEAEKSRALHREEIRQGNEERRREEIRRENEERRREEIRHENEERRRKEERQAKKDSEKRATKKPERTKTKPPAGFDNITGGRSRRRSSVSMTQEQIAELNRLRQGELDQQQREREASERWEHDDQMTAAQTQYASRPTPSLSQQQETAGYYSTRGTGSNVSRRGSISRRDSASYTPVITQPAPPQTYHTRPGSSSQYPSATYLTPSSSRPSARHSSYPHENPFAQPPTRTSDSTISSQDPTNPFAAPSDRPIHPSSIHQAAPDAWNNNALRNSLPPVSTSSTYSRQGQNPLYMTGQQVINRSGDPTAYRRAQAATHNINRAMNADTAYESDSSSEELEPESTRSSRHGAKLGSGKGKKRRS